VLNFRVLLPQC